MSSFFTRLKERKLVHWAVAYLAGSWLVLQVLDVLATPFAWPDLVLRTATILLAIGFLGVLVLAWYHGERGRQRVSGIELLMLAGILAIAAAAMGLVARGGRDAQAAPPASPAPTAAGTNAKQGSIAVLPFLDLSPAHDQEYFTDGLAEELLDALARVPGLRVASRTSAFAFKNSDAGVDSIARALRVANVLEGSVRKAGDRVRITAQLISARTGYHLWTETYDRELKDVFAVQDEISHAIVGALAVKLAGGPAAARLVKEETRDPEAHDLVLKGEYFVRQNNREGLERARGLFQQAIVRDSGYARAYAGLAGVYAQQAYMRYGPRDVLMKNARQAADRAMTLDSTLAETQYVLGNLAWEWDRDLLAAEAHYRRAIALNPGLATPRSRRAWNLMNLGRTDEALAEAKYAAELDPVSSGVLNNLGAMYAYAHQMEPAVQAYESALALQPDNPISLGNLAVALSQVGRLDDAVRSVERALALDSTDQYTLATSAYVHARAGRRADAEKALATLRAQPEPSPYLLATAYAGLGDRDRLFAALDRAVTERDESAFDLRVDPVFDPYRSDPRMQRLIARIGYPDE